MVCPDLFCRVPDLYGEVRRVDDIFKIVGIVGIIRIISFLSIVNDARKEVANVEICYGTPGGGGAQKT